MTHTINIYSIRTLIGMIGIACLLLPQLSHAYFTTAQKAMPIPEASALFLVTFAFGSKSHDVYIPIRASNTNNHTAEAVSYTVYDEDGAQAIGKVEGIVLSDAKITGNGMYHIPKGESRSLTLVVPFTPTVTTAVNEYRLQVTHLPFMFDGTQHLQLNPSELKYYTTKFIEI